MFVLHCNVTEAGAHAFILVYLPFNRDGGPQPQQVTHETTRHPQEPTEPSICLPPEPLTQQPLTPMSRTPDFVCSTSCGPASTL